MPPPCDSPKVVTRKSWPNVFAIALLLDRSESELEIVDQITHVFYTDGQPNERVGHAERFSFFLRHGGVGHERGMIDQTLHAAQTFGQGKQMRVLEKLFRPRKIGFENHRDHSTEPAHLRAREIVVRV